MTKKTIEILEIALKTANTHQTITSDDFVEGLDALRKLSELVKATEGVKNAWAELKKLWAETVQDVKASLKR